MRIPTTLPAGYVEKERGDKPLTPVTISGTAINCAVEDTSNIINCQALSTYTRLVRVTTTVLLYAGSCLMEEPCRHRYTCIATWTMGRGAQDSSG